LNPGELIRGLVGTSYYIAPEVIMSEYDCKVGYNEKADIWSIGVLAYVLLSGCSPFNGKNDKEIMDSVKRGLFEFPKDRFDGVSLSAK